MRVYIFLCALSISHAQTVLFDCMHMHLFQGAGASGNRYSKVCITKKRIP